MSQSEKKKLNRRQFISGAASAVAAFTIVPRHVLGGTGHTPPSEKLNIAAVGAGGMGASNIRNIAGENGAGENIVLPLENCSAYQRNSNPTEEHTLF